MQLTGKISIFIDRKVTTIEIRDEISRTTFVSITLTPEQLSSALSRLAYTDCMLDVNNIDRVGKTYESNDFIFEIPKELANSTHSIEL
jgi:hypothetical protein